MKLRAALLALFFFSLTANSQIDREFWFSIPDIIDGTYTNFEPNHGLPIYLNITALYNTTVRISRPADAGFEPVVFALSEMDNQHVNLLGLPGMSLGKVETEATGSVETNGFLIESWPGEIAVTLEWGNEDNKEIMPLKGKNALGTDFIISTQNILHNFIPGGGSGTPGANGFVIVASENNTNVTIRQEYDFGHRNVVGFPADIIPVTLNRGETYAVRGVHGIKEDNITGVEVTSDKDIAISYYDDALIPCTNTKDISADQVVPTSLAGSKYFIQKGYLDSIEYVFITTTQNNTSIQINGVPQPLLPNRGDTLSYVLTTDSLYINANKPIYVNQITGIDCQVSSAIVPSMESCTGSHEVLFKRGLDNLDGLHLRIVARNTSARLRETFSIINETDTHRIPFGYFSYSADSNFLFLDENSAIINYISNATTAAYGSGLKIYNPTGRFHASAIMGNSTTGAKFGYFSDYAGIPISAGIGGYSYLQDTTKCDLLPLRFAASGGETYVWTGVSDPGIIAFLSDDSIAAPVFTPDTAGVYEFNVEITGACGSANIKIKSSNFPKPAANFILGANEGCSPDSILIENLSNATYIDKVLWSFMPSIDTVDQASQPTPFYYNLPNNLSDTIQTYFITLNTYSPDPKCRNSRTKTFNLKPQVDASFTVSDTMGCSPLLVQFEETAVSGHDSIGFRWNFRNGAQSTDTTPKTTFTNLTTATKIYNVELITETPLGCTDTANIPITIHPAVEAAFGIDTNLSCSPLVATLNPGSSINADSLFWNIDSETDSIHRTDTTLPLTLTHIDTSIAGGPDTLYVYLIVENAQGCRDTTPTAELFVYPNINAEFDIDKNSLCDSDSILFTNLSDGYKPRYEWDFGNSSYSQDTSLKSHTVTYYNRTESDSTFTIRLKAISDNICSSTMDTTITVHPFVLANFGFSYANSCSPVDALFTNTSLSFDSVYWDFGDGNFSVDTSHNFNHIFNNLSPDRDTNYHIRLYTYSTEGCSDSADQWISVVPEVVADFTISDSSLCSNSFLDFTNNSSGNNLTYQWDFGNLESGTLPDATFTRYYENNTPNDLTYTITVTVSNAIGCSDYDTATVDVLAFIDADFNLTEYMSCSEFTINPLNASDSSANEFRWDFGPAGTSSLKDPVGPTYTNTGITPDTIPILLAVAGANDSAHWACADTHRHEIVVYPELQAGFELDSTSGCQPLSISITDTTNIKAGTNYAWYVNKEWKSSSPTPPSISLSNDADTARTDIIWLYARSKDNCYDTAFQTVQIFPLIDAAFSLSRVTMCDYDSVNVNRTISKGDIANVEWLFNGTPEVYTDSIFKYSFDGDISSSPVNRTIELKLENSFGCRDSTLRNITLYPVVTAGYALDTTVNEVCFPRPIEFTNTSVNSDEWIWQFGDGQSSSDFEPDNVYANPSKIDSVQYRIVLRSESDYGCWDDTTSLVTIWGQPKAQFLFDSIIGCPPIEVDMINKSIGSNLAYFWTYAGTNSTAKDTSFVFNNNADTIQYQPVTLLVTSDRGCTDTRTESIKVYPNLQAAIYADKSAGCSPLVVNLNVQDTSNVKFVSWYLDSLPTSKPLFNPTYRFVNNEPNDVTHTIRMVASSVHGCTSTRDTTITVYPSPNGYFIASPVPTDYDYTTDQTIINFSNQTPNHGIWDYDWDFGDGTTNQQTESATSFSHTYGANVWGNKDNFYRLDVILNSTNPANPECMDIDTVEIIIRAPLPQVEIFEDISGCIPLTVDFSAETKYIYEDSRVWEFGYGLGSNNEVAPTFTYTEPGQYNVTLTVEGDAGKMSDFKIITVHPKPTVDFSFNDTIVAINIDTVNFNNHSRQALEYFWFFNSENIPSGDYNSDEENPTWTYSEPGVYYPALIAKSTDDCYDTLIHTTGIQVFEVGTVLFPNTFLAIVGQPSEEYASDQTIDGGNRYLFYPKHESVDQYHLEIYNRWGSLIFESHEVDRGWNGLIEGEMAKQDVYVYRARGRFVNGQAYDINGDITLLHTHPGAQ